MSGTLPDARWGERVVAAVVVQPAQAASDDDLLALVRERLARYGFTARVGQGGAIGAAWAQRTKSTTETTDYEFLHGVGVQEIRGIDKLRFGTAAGTDTTTPKDHGIVTWIGAAAAD